jgi:hypothetical protein
MRRQPPTIRTAEQIEAVLKEARLGSYGVPAYGKAATTVRRRRLAGESDDEALARWAREEQLEAGRDADPRLKEIRETGSGRVLPVRYDD